MSKVAYDQSGYIGQSMSVRARAAYNNGEMPASKWTKTAMIDALRDWCDDNDRTFTGSVCKMRKSDIFDRLFECTSWHHTGKFAARTDFYGVDEDAASEMFEPMDAAELAAREAFRGARRAEEQAREEASEARRAAMAADLEGAREWQREHGCSPWSIGAALLVCPERVRVWTTRKGAVRLGVLPQDGSWRQRDRLEVAASVAEAWYADATDYVDYINLVRFDARKPETYDLLAVRSEGDFDESGNASACDHNKWGDPSKWLDAAKGLGLL